MLDELVNTIKTLQARIDAHRDALINEAQTRLSLIDPLLRALGWDTADPALVRGEFPLMRGRADYALLGENQLPVAIIEAKRLNEPLGNAEMQLLPYAFTSNVGYAVLTDGNHWVVYKTFRQSQNDPSGILDLSLANLPARECALKLLLLWHPNLASGQPIEAGMPVSGTKRPQPLPPPPPPPPLPHRDWNSLSEFVPAPHSKPARLRLPGDNQLDVTSWRGLFIELSEWLVRDGVLTKDKCPVSLGRSNAFSTVNLQPRHPNGKEFLAPHRLSNGLFLAPHGSAQDVIYRCRLLMNRLGKDPATVHVYVG